MFIVHVDVLHRHGDATAGYWSAVFMCSWSLVSVCMRLVVMGKRLGAWSTFHADFTYANVFDSNFTLKIKIKDIEDLDENWHVKVPCQHAYVYQNYRF